MKTKINKEVLKKCLIQAGILQIDLSNRCKTTGNYLTNLKSEKTLHSCSNRLRKKITDVFESHKVDCEGLFYELGGDEK